MTRVILTIALLAPAFPAAAQTVDPAACPLHATHMKEAADQQSGHDRHAEMEKRGHKTMGFDQSKATHHFKLAASGGSIEIEANSAADAETKQQIVTHLKDIAVKFQSGDFDIPFATHAETPDGVAGMKRFKEAISYTFEALPSGGRVVIRSTTKDALASIHEFLRYQIREHRTGDPVAIPR